MYHSMKFFVKISGLILTAAMFSFSCSQPAQEQQQAPADSTAMAPKPVEPPHWTYEGEHGPANWMGLSEEFKECGQGQNQSPIDIKKKAAATADLKDVVFNYQPSAVTLVNNGHTIQANFPAGCSIMVDSVAYDLAQLHFHTPGEHMIDSTAFPLEIHLVHKNAAGALAVVGLMVSEGDSNAVLGSLLANLPAQANSEAPLADPLKIADVLPAKKDTYRYSGSLTTPPCTEGVSWIVMTNPIMLSAGQISAFKALYAMNNRPVQALNTRAVQFDVAK